jgi:ketosteroid isomerase-like protein
MQRSSKTLSEDQQNKIWDDIQTVITQIRDAAANVDSTKLYDAFTLDDKGFTYVDIDGTSYDQSAYRQMVHEFYGPLQSEIIAKGKERFTYLSEDNVLWNYSGALTATFKNGEKATYDPFAMTMLFKKTNNKWKVVFLQESTQEPSDTTKH